MTGKPKVSVIVPTKNSSATLAACLESIKAQTYQNVELIVVDNSSSDKTPIIAERLADKFFTKGPERSAQRNYGVKESTGEYVLIIDSDMELKPKVVEQCVEQFEANPQLLGLVIPEESFGTGFWAQCKKLERSFYVGVSWMEAARCFSRKTFDEMHGYDEENTGTEDYDLPQRIMAKYGKDTIGRIDELIMHDEQLISLIVTCKKKFYYAQKLDKYKSDDANKGNFQKQSNPLNRYKLFFSKPTHLFKNPVIGLGMLFMKTTEFGSGALGLVKGKLNA